ncbi:hypothetical protein [Hyphomicrobium sp.]|uniref:hypothetical protein n=1 Tax=Hyphomicrobium sp. TaxID=82 RepID=UPI0025BA3F88|nr:hypothetical protein [Hyphomicrobium sp.]
MRATRQAKFTNHARTKKMRKTTLSHLLTLRHAPFAVAIFAGLAIAPIAAGAREKAPVDESTIGQAASLIVADAHPFLHCHTIFTRTYCHKKDRLPENWPPHTDTPHSGVSKDKTPCPKGETDCGTKPSYGRG